MQRRNQKIVEETPSQFLLHNLQLRRDLCEVAVRLAKSVNYRSAGTVEFLVVDEGSDSVNTGKFFFLEMNTRLQVEHGITEMVNDVDLVEWMIYQGNLQKTGHNTLNMSTFHWKPTGHAIEVRIYAENPSLNFQPSPGLLTHVKWPAMFSQLRVDTWAKSGTKVTTGYDSLIAKMMAYGTDRDGAIDILSNALLETIVAGPFTNLDYLLTVLQHKDFTSGNTTTHMLKQVEYTPQAIRVLQGGPDTTVQDLPGHMGLRVYGIQCNGPMDDVAFKVANILVGNKQCTSGLEITMQGPKLYFYVPTLVAITSADMEVILSVPGAEPVQKALWSRLFIPARSTLAISKVPRGSAGCRCYMAVLGGLNVPDYLGSKSTFAAFGYGGFQGRALQVGDMLPLTRTVSDSQVQNIAEDLILPIALRPTYQKQWEIKVMPGPHADPDYVKPEGMDEMFSVDWEVHYNSAKMGVRLSGPTPKWSRSDGGYGGTHPSNIHDNGYALGSVNFIGDSPVLLTCDGPTQGGFTCPWTVISTEMWKLGQVYSGDIIHFHPISIDDALEIRTSHDDYFAHITQIATYHPLSVPSRTFPLLTNTACGKTDFGKKHHNCAILDELPADAKSDRPCVQYRQCGDCYILTEYGDPKGPVDLNIFARVRVLQDALRLHTDTKTQKVENALIPGTFDAAPCVRSLLIRYDSRTLPQSTLVEYLKTLELDLPDVRKVVFLSRDIRMPFVFDDKWSQEATKQYIQLIRKEASYLPCNVDFIAKNNGLTGGKTEVLKHVSGTPFLTVGVGFFLGCPFLCPINPLDRLKVPKYNLSRLYTPAGTVGMGGSLCAIYPLDTPGGYQMFGRTIPTWDTFGSVQPFTPYQPWLLSLFDKVTFYQVSEDELLHFRRLALAGKYKYDICKATFDMTEYNKLVGMVTKEYAVRDKKYKKASAGLKVLDDELLNKQAVAPVNVKQDSADTLDEGQEACQALMYGCVKNVTVKAEDSVTATGTVLCMLEAMKTEIAVTCDVSGTVVQVLVVPGQVVTPIDIVCILQTHK